MKCEDEDKRVCMTMPVEECKGVIFMTMLMMARMMIMMILSKSVKIKTRGFA